MDGEKKKLTRGELMVYVRQADPDLRAAAYQELYRVYGEDGPHPRRRSTRPWCATGATRTCPAQVFQPDRGAQPGTTIFLMRWSTPCWMSASDNAAIFQRFFRLKARWLGLQRLRRYDIYAPVARLR